MVIDKIGNETGTAYGALPNRLMVLNSDSTMFYRGGMGPHKFDPEEWRKAIQKLVDHSS